MNLDKMNCLVNAAQAEKMRNAALNGDDDDQETCSPRDIDILLGRGRTHFQHHGNRRFRKVVAKNLQAYLDTQSRYGKTKMVRKITEECLEGGTRFLRIKKDSNSWYQVRISVARDKVGHALRDASSDKSRDIHKMHEQFEGEKKMKQAKKKKEIEQKRSITIMKAIQDSCSAAIDIHVPNKKSKEQTKIKADAPTSSSSASQVQQQHHQCTKRQQRKKTTAITPDVQPSSSASIISSRVAEQQRDNRAESYSKNTTAQQDNEENYAKSRAAMVSSTAVFIDSRR